MRARGERLWVGETPNKRLLSDEERYAEKSTIQKILYHNEVATERDVIKQAFVEHYSELLTCAKRREEGFQREFLQPMLRLDDEVKARLEEPISLVEIERAIGETSVGKSPGTDGLGAAFYKEFKAGVSHALDCVILEAYDAKQMPPSYRASHKVLIPKSDDLVKLLSVGSYRPISLTNTDCALFMNVLASRMQSFIKYLVGSHQTYGIKGRTICTNIHTARSVLQSCDAVGSRVAMMQLGLAKASANMYHEVLFAILQHVNIGSVILDGVKTAYVGCSTRIIINKSLSDAVAVRSSVKQSCPLPSLLFALYL